MRRRTVLGSALLTLTAGCSAELEPEPEPEPDTSYREPFRPQFHFTPARNWMNDPNGLVHYDGEYHLFYQYNPFGIRWGHMSWGHAVSPDLVHWRHLPVAIPEAGGVMAFSGSAVVDWNNTSGFGSPGQPPLVAVYTGHRPADEIQSQYVAYSTDRGRSWTVWEGNPVLDPGWKDFRDPKVFWYAPDQRWVMVVALSAQQKVHFYGSPDLKQWELLGEFGPAGAVDGLWECPDLFPLAVDGEPGRTKWVLEVDLGDNAVAGGSGGQYFAGEFDGRTFRAEPLGASAWAGPGPAQWVDYGADFYAPISWSDVPASDGRRLWVGWMNNWKYAQDIPTEPWRSAQSVPRSLSLSTVGDGLRLRQTPVRELEQLRGAEFSMPGRQLENEALALSESGLEAASAEIVAVFETGSAERFGLRVRTGAGERTEVGYDAEAGELYLDRSQSGRSEFSDVFAARHAGPLPAADGVVKLHLFVDWSSVEVFGNDGLTVITDQVFPRPDSTGLEVFAEGGGATLLSLRVWQLKSAW